jgi:hypothetical protein
MIFAPGRSRHEQAVLVGADVFVGATLGIPPGDLLPVASTIFGAVQVDPAAQHGVGIVATSE